MKEIKKIAVLCGGTSAERSVSLRSGANVFKAIQELSYDVVMIDPSMEVIPQDIDLAFLALHGTGGEDGSIQGLLDLKGIRYTGSNLESSAIAYNKITCKKLLEYHGLPTANFKELKSLKDCETVSFFPQIIKPALEGSSIGIQIIDSMDELLAAYKELSKKYTNLFVEDYISGREITISILAKDIYPILELIPKNRFYDFEAKYTKGMTEFLVPADLSIEAELDLKAIALDAYTVIGCKGAARVDMIITEEDAYILEINTIPGMTDSSDLPAQAKSAGLSFNDLVQRIIDAA